MIRRVATAVATAVLLLGGVPLTGTAAAQEVRPATEPLRLELTELAPRVVTAAGPGVLTVAGTLTNTGPVPVDGLVVRVQRGDPLATEGDVRDALDGLARTDAVTPQFVPLTGALAPGAAVPVRLVVPLTGAPEVGLALSRTGVHEVLVNVNGVPEGGQRARLAAVRVLLPVLSLPARPGTPTEPVPFSLVYPITDVPYRLSTVDSERTVLTDDTLAASFAPGGRLDGLVAALATAAPEGSVARSATCLAIDPDLVQTARAMVDSNPPYVVLGPDGAPVPGTGAAAAADWLARLADVARGGCVIALPFADADLVALTRGGLGDRATSAVTDGRAVLTELLGTPVADGVTWPAEGAVDTATLDRIAAAGDRTLLLSAASVEGGPPGGGTAPLAGGRSAVLTDPLLTAAAAGPPDRDVDPEASRGAAAPAASPAGTDAPLSTQDTIGALAFRAQQPGGPDPVVLAPPHRWGADGTGAAGLLRAVDALVQAGLLTPRPLGPVLAEGAPPGPPSSVTYPLDAVGREVPPGVVGTVRDTVADIDDLRSAAVDGSGVGLSPDEAFAPLQRGAVRPVSALLRGRPEAAAATAAAGRTRIRDLRGSVRVLEPTSPYSLGTSDAPLLVTVTNGLPVTVRVRLEIASRSGLRVAPMEPPEIPPLGRRQVRVDAEVTRSGQFTVQAAVRTPDGGLLGPPSRLRVRSTVYGTITVWLTGSAGVLLVVLVARRVVRRIRSEPVSRGLPPAALPPAGPADLPPAPRPDVPAARSPDLPLHPPVGVTTDRLPLVPRRDPLSGDPFPVGPTDRLPPVRPRRPPGPDPAPRVPRP